MAQFWIAIFFILLAVAQLYQSVKDINLPLPVYLVLGAILAVASNSQQQFSVSLDRQTTLQSIEQSDPLLSLVQSPISSNDLKSVEAAVLPILLAEPEQPPSEVTLEANLKSVEAAVLPILLAEPEQPQSEVKPEANLKSVEKKKSRKRTTSVKTRK
jgi:hypothetical protein